MSEEEIGAIVMSVLRREGVSFTDIRFKVDEYGDLESIRLIKTDYIETLWERS